MPAPLKKLKFSDPRPPDECEFIVRFFASAGSDYDDLPERLVWLPFSSGPDLRAFWLEARDTVCEVVPIRAFDLMNEEFDRGERPRQFENWPVDLRREIYALCVPTGARYWIDKSGRTLLLGTTTENYLADLARLKAAAEPGDEPFDESDE